MKLPNFAKKDTAMNLVIIKLTLQVCRNVEGNKNHNLSNFLPHDVMNYDSIFYEIPLSSELWFSLNNKFAFIELL
jgi:hypothetical protein